MKLTALKISNLKTLENKMIKIFINLLPILKKVRNKLLSIVFRDQLFVYSISSLYPDSRKICLLPSIKIPVPETNQIDFHWKTKDLQKEYYSVPEAYICTLQGVIFCPKRNILLSNSPRSIIYESISRCGFSGNISPNKSEYERELNTISGTASAIRSLYNNMYYHMLIDDIPRLYQLCNHEALKTQNIKLLFSSPLSEAENFFLKKLLPSNFEITTVCKNSCYLVEEFIFSSFISGKYSGYLAPEFIAWFQGKVLPNRPRNKTNRILILRRGRRRIVNNQILLKLLEKEGFKGYFLEDMSIEEQVELFYDADFVVATHGAGLSNIIFSSRIKVLELFSTPQVLPHYFYLSKSLGHKYKYWCGNKMFRDSNFEVNISEIMKLVNKFE